MRSWHYIDVTRFASLTLLPLPFLCTRRDCIVSGLNLFLCNNTFLLTTDIHFKTVSKGLHTISPVTVPPFKAFCKLHCLNFGKYIPKFCLNHCTIIISTSIYTILCFRIRKSVLNLVFREGHRSAHCHLSETNPINSTFQVFLPCFPADGRCHCITGALQFVLAEQIHVSILLISEQSALLVGHGDDGVWHWDGCSLCSEPYP